MNRLINRQFLKSCQETLSISHQMIIRRKYQLDTNINATINTNYNAIRSVAMQKHLTPTGVISGGWLMSQMDIAGGVLAWDIIRGPIYTIACEQIQFHKAVNCGDLVSFYPNLVKRNTTSIKVFVEGKIRRPPDGEDHPVITGTFIYVPINKGG